MRTTVNALKGVSKFAGPAGIALTGVDVYNDINTYSGTARVKAVTLSCHHQKEETLDERNEINYYYLTHFITLTLYSIRTKYGFCAYVWKNP
jgi:hypothetical protein